MLSVEAKMELRSGGSVTIRVHVPKFEGLTEQDYGFLNELLGMLHDYRLLAPVADPEGGSAGAGSQAR